MRRSGSKVLSRIGAGLGYCILVIAAFISLLPLYWVFTTALQLHDEVISHVPPLVPRVALEYIPTLLGGDKQGASRLVADSLENLRVLFTRTDMVRWFLNSLIVSGSATLIILFLDSLSAYAFAKKQFPGRDLLFWILISTMMIPGHVTLVPMFRIITNLGLRDNLLGVILPDIAMVFGVFLLRQFMRTIPTEMIEAAKIDGASEFTIYSRVILPLAKPGIATLAILTFNATWNSFLWPLIVLNKSQVMTLQVGLKTLLDRNLVDYGMQMSGAAVAAFPVIIVFLLFQGYFVKGLTLGSLKG